MKVLIPKLTNTSLLFVVGTIAAAPTFASTTLDEPTRGRHMGRSDINSRRDISKKMSQFRLHETLLAPLSGVSGIDHERRLARNAARLGVATDDHRKLLAFDIPEAIVELWNATTPPPPPYEGPRLSFEREDSPQRLPFGDGVGQVASLPSATREFWTGKDKDGNDVPMSDRNANNMWEVVACPVVDVETFMVAPWTCIFGSSPAATLFDFFGDGVTQVVRGVTQKMIPLIIESVTDLGGADEFMDSIEEIVKPLCELLDVIESIYDFVRNTIKNSLNTITSAVSSVKDAVQSVSSKVSTVTNTINSVVESIDDIEDVVDGIEDIVDSLPTLGDIEDALNPFRRRLDEDETSTLYELVGNLVEELNSADDRIVEALHLALGTDGQSHVSILEGILQVATSVDEMEDGLQGMEEGLRDTVQEQCPVPKSEEDLEVKSMLRKSRGFKEAAAQAAAKAGVGEETVEDIASYILDQMKEVPSDLDDELIKEVKDSFDSSDLKNDLKRRVLQELEASTDKIVIDTATDLFRNSLGKQEATHHRRLGSLGNSCRNGVSSVKDLIKGAINKVVELVVFGLGGLQSLGEDFNEMKSEGEEFEEIYTFVYSVISVMDPLSSKSLILEPLRGLYKFTQVVTSIFLFGCSPTLDETCDKILPSQKNEVIKVKETRSGDFFLSSGCDSEFEGELIFGVWALELIEKLLQVLSDIAPKLHLAAGASLGAHAEAGAEIDIIGIPLKITELMVSYLQNLIAKLDSTCAYLDSYVEFAKVEATYENSLLALQELTCRNPHEDGIQMQRGYGCDGLDNDCDPDKQIDECEEDIFPPEISIEQAMLRCSDKIFPTKEEAVFCFKSLISAEDDCKEVVLTVESSEPVNSQATIEIKAVAQGCEMREIEDTTIVTVPVLIGEVELLRGYGCDGIDNNQNGFDNKIDLDQVVDECAEDVFPPEIDATLAIDKCAKTIFPTSDDALACIEAPGMVLATDDCKEVEVSFEKEDSDCSTSVTITAKAQGCGGRPEDTTELVVGGIYFDQEAPVVTCSLGVTSNELDGRGGAYVDLQLSYNAHDGVRMCTDKGDLAVGIEVFSNELVDYKTAIFTAPRGDGPPRIFAENNICNNSSSGGCKVISLTGAREYTVRVSATDKAGNTGSAECTSQIVPSAGATETEDDDPLFSIGMFNLVGGSEGLF